MKARYLIYDVTTPRGVCRLEAVSNVPQWAHMHKSEPQAGRFPADASFRMSRDFPKDIKLADSLSNTNDFLVVSEKLKDFLAQEEFLAHNEVHPVAIVNHKGRKETARYFIIHQIDDPACVDETKTKGAKSKLMPDEYSVMKKLVLDETKIPPDYAIFRAAQYKSRILFRSDVAEKIQAAGFTGLKFSELKGYDDFY